MLLWAPALRRGAHYYAAPARRASQARQPPNSLMSRAPAVPTVSQTKPQASLPSATDKAVVWQLLAEERTLPLSRARAVAVAFWRPGQDEMLAPYAERFLQLIPALNRSGTAPAQAYSRWLYPTHGIDATYLDRAATVAKTATPIVHSGVLERGDLVARMLHARVD